ncbi:glycosyltransferase [Vibrio scophthalmi]|uniref:Glycosyltransferase subfamily 4-like N-terminal domain-containing protein n=1 Tax=Vibrio scophthalmi TaxID=45658 RepID=A0A1E3WJJ2_9VIBR|nr:glycosyltransferase [Vibrio scophthalmi]ODS09949.1 hypothetical protein VSF3289_00187 [Vibrio scophthalmi]
MKKLLIIGDAGSIHLKKWTDDFLQSFDVYVFTFSSENKTNVPDSKVFYYKSIFTRKVWFITAIFSLLRVVKVIKPDLIHVHYASSYGFLGSFTSHGKKVLSIWGSDLNFCDKSFFRRVLMRWTLMNYDVVNCASQALRRKAEKICSDADYQVFQYGIDVNIPTKTEVYNSERPVFILNRGLSSLYRVDYVIDEFKHFIEHGGAGILKIYGYGSKKETDFIKSKVELISCESVIFEGVVEQCHLYSEMKSADYYISIPCIDGAPLALYEAMHIGLYPIVSNIDSNQETFSKGQADFLNTYKPGDLSLLLFELTSKDFNVTAVDKNRVVITDDYNYIKNMNRMKNIYIKLLGI